MKNLDKHVSWPAFEKFFIEYFGRPPGPTDRHDEMFFSFFLAGQTPPLPEPAKVTFAASAEATHVADFLLVSLDNIANQLAVATSTARDDIISDAITRRLGHSKWRQDIFSLVGRLSRAIDKDLQGETVALDGAPIIYLRRVQVTQEEHGFSHKLKVSFQYNFIDA